LLPSPTQSVPGGFLLVFFGVLFLVASALAGYASWLDYHKIYLEHQATEYSLTSLLLCFAATLVVGLGLVIFGLRMAMDTGPYNTHDPKEPGVKF
jgi:ABC-type sulfate transport system permease component